MKKPALLLLSFCFALLAFAQTTVTLTVKDSATSEPLSGVTITATQIKKAWTTDTAGVAVLPVTGRLLLQLSAVGYQPKTFFIDSTQAFITVWLQTAANTLAGVIVSSSRTESRIENLPTRVEVLGTEEVEEEGGIKPANIASLLGDVAGIQSQQTSAVTGNTEMRVQGLPGSYTQLLRDGMPLFGDFAGSFSVLQIPPLDLKQIEIIKGATSTLYGGGAIAGMINVISKTPRMGKPERTLLLNYSTLNEANANLYIANRNEKVGYTFFAGGTHQQPTDVNKGGYSDVPILKSVFLHPTLYFYLNHKSTLSVGYNGLWEDRKGGDMLVLRNKKDGLHQFFIQNLSARHTTDLQWDHRINPSKRLTVKAIGSWYNRDITTNTFGMQAVQLSYYSEAAYVIKSPKHDIVLGGNVNGERFRKGLPDSTLIPNYNHSTLGLFVQDDWRLHPKFTLESGMRSDFNSTYGSFFLPRISLLYKISPAVTTRIGGGLGYKLPTLFNSEIDERDYQKLQPLKDAQPERSYGGNWDINYRGTLGHADLTINQMFYITKINHPLVPVYGSNSISLINATKGILTKGFETYLQLDYNELELYLGYTLTDARKLYDAAQPHLELSARNKFASVLAYEFTDHFRAGVEAAVTGPQYLEDGSRSPSFLFMAGMVRYDIKSVSLVLNGENLLDYRQSKKEAIVSGPVDNPVFKQLWAPIDGRVVNLSMRVRF